MEFKQNDTQEQQSKIDPEQNETWHNDILQNDTYMTKTIKMKIFVMTLFKMTFDDKNQTK